MSILEFKNFKNLLESEIKKSSNPGINAIKNFDVVKKFEMEVGNGIVLCMSDDIFAIDENNYYIPIEYI